MKVALITDSHFGCRGDSEVFHKYIEKFYINIFFPYLVTNNIKEIIHLGDQFDRRKYVNFATLQKCKNYFYDKLVDYDIFLQGIVGNHDVTYKNTNKINAPNLLLNEYSKNMNVYWDKPVELVYDGQKILFCPWICDENYDESMKAIAETDARVLMGHFEIEGFEMHRGAICEHGQKVDLFGKFDLVCSGHFHHKSTHKNITYLGSPYEMNWNDYGDERGFHIFDTKTGELEFIRNPYSMFHKIDYSDNDMTIEDIANLDTSGLTGSYIKVIVHNKNNPYLFDLFIDKLQKSGAVDIKIIDDHLNLDLVKEDGLVDEAQDTLTILNKYVDTIEFRGDKKRVEHFLRELYTEAINL
jgi:DNA repair exonuclease SbcCD nuclease subunit